MKSIVKLLIIGTGPEEKDLKQYVYKNDLSGYVTFTGHKINVFEELSKMDLFILPSKSEGLGIAITEAMAAGLPVIASNVGGIPEVVIDSVTGFLIPEKDPALLAGAVINLMSNLERGRTMGEKGRIGTAQLSLLCSFTYLIFPVKFILYSSKIAHLIQLSNEAS